MTILSCEQNLSSVQEFRGGFSPAPFLMKEISFWEGFSLLPLTVPVTVAPHCGWRCCVHLSSQPLLALGNPLTHTARSE